MNVKLGDETLLHILEIFRQGIIEQKDMSQALRDLDLEQRADGKLYVRQVCSGTDVQG